ncbi:hypothetical protein K2173_001532 [Erythroxylum novogranatense]|uniref:Receptor-like serine/threonine-protein kinase n=1 Tax=Erythroxylum novogranatense TaxID=1862640 RepID=A0AAV8T4X0_9ROSI|nr:hypothetical protein K2173_001532 [Erythroxylum novogranatense]
MKSVFLFCFICYLFSLVLFCHAINSITTGQSVKDGETLISVDEIYELGFFSPEKSDSRYLGIWYHNRQDEAVIWVANRDKPISDRNGTLRIAEDGNLFLRDGNGNSVWSSNASELSNDTTAILDRNGNLILSSAADTSKSYWESFSHPTDTYLPNMRVLVSQAMGENHFFSSWKSATDPSPGNFTMGVDPRGAPQIVVWENSKRRWRSGHWNAQIFTGVPNMSVSTNYQYGFKFTTISGNLYLTYVPSNPSDLLRYRITWDGIEEQLKWNEGAKEWDVLQRQPANECELYNYCGNFGVCSISKSPKCSCMEGFEPTFPDQWRNGYWSGGCKRRSLLQCQRNSNATELSSGEDGFKALRCMKLPDFTNVTAARTVETCQQTCLQNCSCNAFAFISGIGCMTWTEDLIDMQDFGKVGFTMYLRLADSEFAEGRKLSPAVIVVIVLAGATFLALSLWLFWRYNTKLKVLPAATTASWMRKNEIPISDLSKSKEYSTDFSGPADLITEGSQMNGAELPLFSFSQVAAATNNFSDENKLGQGGFGPVYRGKLPGAEEIAVKRLSKVSGQGLDEFKNEVILIAKLQHRNLVRLLGCCIEGEEKILVYEYMANKSLDCFLFDHSKQGLLDWFMRFTIIEGIARGLLYLHRDSRLRIIHRDLKASNILLDEDMNPKISDFGMARIFGGNQNEANTNRVVGTYGYMSPEYAMEGLFSVKSDVFSFGVLVLEIVSGRRNTSFRATDHVSLIAYAWQLWSEGKAMELIDPAIRNSCPENQVLRCLQIAMLCVQDSAVQRPTMAHVLLMIESNSILPLPRQPTFTSMRTSVDADFYLDCQEIVSTNDLTVTMVVGR